MDSESGLEGGDGVIGSTSAGDGVLGEKASIGLPGVSSSRTNVVFVRGEMGQDTAKSSLGVSSAVDRSRLTPTLLGVGLNDGKECESERGERRLSWDCRVDRGRLLPIIVLGLSPTKLL